MKFSVTSILTMGICQVNRVENERENREGSTAWIMMHMIHKLTERII